MSHRFIVFIVSFRFITAYAVVIKPPIIISHGRQSRCTCANRRHAGSHRGDIQANFPKIRSASAGKSTLACERGFWMASRRNNEIWRCRDRRRKISIYFIDNMGITGGARRGREKKSPFSLPLKKTSRGGILSGLRSAWDFRHRQKGFGPHGNLDFNDDGLCHFFSEKIPTATKSCDRRIWSEPPISQVFPIFSFPGCRPYLSCMGQLYGSPKD